MKNFEDAIFFYIDNPVAFFEDILGMEPDGWQKAVLEDLANYPKISVRSGQGVGKTALEAGAIIWFLICHPYAKVVATAPTMQQLYDVLWAEIAKWLEHSAVKNILKWTKTKIYMRGDEERWFATAKTATKPENMQGFHEDYMLIVVDEASGIAEPIMEAILGTLSGEYNKLLLCGNPNRLDGTFYDSHNDDRDKYKTHKVSSKDSSRTSKDNIDMLIRKYGKDSDVARVRIYGDFPRGSVDSFITLEVVEEAAKGVIKKESLSAYETLHIGVDVARFGDDETVITPRIGMKVFDQEIFRNQDTMQTTGNILRLTKLYFKQFPNLKKAKVKIDDTGVGGGVTDRLNELKREQNMNDIEIYGINNGAAAKDQYYSNLGTEAWGQLKSLLEENFSNQMQGKERVIEIPNEPTLIKELRARKYFISSRGKIQLESKKEMKNRNLGSPDRADSLVLAIYEPPKVKIKGFSGGI